MNEERNQVIEKIEEKFTRCPECRSFSVRQAAELTFKERIKAAFVPLKVNRCDNCSYRFTESESFSVSIRHLFHSLSPGHSGKNMVIAVLIGLAAALVIVLLLAGGKKEPVITTGKKPIQPIVKNPDTKIKEPPQQVLPAEKPASTSTPAIAGEIVLENSNRFGVNWRPIREGVQITRLSNGSLKRAGFLVGDILVEVDGKKVVGEGIKLETARDDVYYGRRSEALIKVLRGEETLLFKMIKRKR